MLVIPHLAIRVVQALEQFLAARQAWVGALLAAAAASVSGLSAQVAARMLGEVAAQLQARTPASNGHPLQPQCSAFQGMGSKNAAQLQARIRARGAQEPSEYI